MEIRPAEKLIIIMLTDVYKKLGIVGDIDADFVKNVILDDHEWALNWKYPGIFPDQKNEVVSEVVDILDMWRFIEDGLEALDHGERQELDKAIEPFNSSIRFDGFDGNNEIDHMSVARCLIEDLGRFAHFSGRPLNSHHASIDAYRHMLERFGPIRSRLTGRPLTLEELKEILRGKIHPTER